MSDTLNVLETHGLSKEYKRSFAVNKVDITIKQGEIYGLIGKNGAGKTTLIRMITGLARPSSGFLRLFESDNLDLQRKRIGAVVDTPAVHAGLSARQNLCLYTKLLGLDDDKIDETLALVGLSEVEKKKVKSFSLGMKQRLGIAICLIGNPDFLILDEPINGLDPTGIREMRELFLRLNRENGITMLISSHILGELSKIATCYGVLNKGTLVEQFTSDELNSRCKRCIKISVDDTVKAAYILETILGITAYDTLDSGVIRVFEKLDDSALINRELSANGVLVSSLYIAGQDLEGYFTELMGGLYDRIG